MALQKSYNHPFKPGTYQGYVWIAETNFNHAKKTGKLTFFVHENEDAANLNYPPIQTIELNLTPTGTPAVLGERPVVTPAVYETRVIGQDEEGNDVTATVLVTPEVYGDAPVLVPAMPSFDELMVANYQTVTDLATAIYGLALTRPEFEGSVVV